MYVLCDLGKKDGGVAPPWCLIQGGGVARGGGHWFHVSPPTITGTSRIEAAKCGTEEMSGHGFYCSYLPCNRMASRKHTVLLP